MAIAYEEQTKKIAAEASARLKKSYMLRHIPTGLYYKPGSGGTLSDKGKIYQSPGNFATSIKRYTSIVTIETKTVEKYRDRLFELYGAPKKDYWGGEYYDVMVVSSDFEKVPLFE